MSVMLGSIVLIVNYCNMGDILCLCNLNGINFWNIIEVDVKNFLIIW